MDKKNKRQGKKCFIITPIGNENSEVFRKAKGVIESAIKPILHEYDFDDIKPAYEINVSGMINTQIINRIVNDDLVVVNLTGNNPNVMYELCLRHVVAKPIIHICENGTSLPFDIKDSRTIFYENDMLGVEELKNKLRSFMDNLSYTDDYIDNPIYTARKYDILLKETQGTETNELLKMLISISNGISELKNAKENIVTQQNNGQANNEWRYEMIYPLGLFKRDISKVDSDKARKYFEESGENVEIAEIARNLDVPPRVIMIIAEMLGIGKMTKNSIVSRNALQHIIEYIISEEV